MATFTTASVKRGGQHHGGDMKEVIADKNYYFDAEGKVTTDESKGERWLAREGANVLEDHREALEAFQGENPGKSGKVAPEEVEEKSEAPKANKKAKTPANKGVK